MNIAQWWVRVTAITFAGWVAFTAGILVACLPQAAGFKRPRGAGRG